MFSFIIVNCPATAVLFNQLMQTLRISKNMNASTPVQVSWLQNPEVVAIKVAQRHRILLPQPFIEIESLKFGVI